MTSKIPLMKEKLIKSILFNTHELITIVRAKLYTTYSNASQWLYSDLEGALCLTVDYSTKMAKFMLFDLRTLNSLFEFQWYTNFSSYYIVYNPIFQYFEVESGFIGFRIDDIQEAEAFSKAVFLLSDKEISKYAKNQKTVKVFEIQQNYETLINLLKQKLAEEYLFKNAYITEFEITFDHFTIEKIISMLNYEGDVLIANGSPKEIEELAGRVLNVKYTETNSLKIQDTRSYALEIYKNIKTTNSLISQGKLKPSEMPNSKNVAAEDDEDPLFKKGTRKPQVGISKPVVQPVQKQEKPVEIPQQNVQPKVPIQSTPKAVDNTAKGIPMPPPIMPMPSFPSFPTNTNTNPNPNPTPVPTKKVESAVDQESALLAAMKNLKKSNEQPRPERLPPKPNMRDQLMDRLKARANVLENNMVESTPKKEEPQEVSEPVVEEKQPERVVKPAPKNRIETSPRTVKPTQQPQKQNPPKSNFSSNRSNMMAMLNAKFGGGVKETGPPKKIEVELARDANPKGNAFNLDKININSLINTLSAAKEKETQSSKPNKEYVAPKVIEFKGANAPLPPPSMPMPSFPPTTSSAPKKVETATSKPVAKPQISNNPKVQSKPKVEAPIEKVTPIVREEPKVVSQPQETTQKPNKMADLIGRLGARFGGGLPPQNNMMSSDGDGNAESSSGYSGGGGGSKAAFELNKPKVDPKTGKVVIDLPEGTSDKDRIDISKLISQGNQNQGAAKKKVAQVIQYKYRPNR